MYLVIWSVSRALCWHTSLRSFIKQSRWHYYDGREILPTDIRAMLFSKQLHWNLIRYTIIFNSNHGVESRNRWMQISEISNVHVRVEAYIVIVSSHPIGCDLKTGSDAIRQVEWLDTMDMYDSTRAWMFEISDVCVHRVRDCTQWILLKMIVVQWNCLLKSMAL